MLQDGSGRSRRKKRLSESADDIEVVHDKETPKLHSILKQTSRTMSESSDDALNVGGVDRQNSSASVTSSEGIITESDESPETPNGRKKSVSFSEQVDQATYKLGNTVSSMHSTLKNKRRRARKKEQKLERQQQRRIRRTSGGSEPSSDEHCTLDDDTSDQVDDKGESKAKDAISAVEDAELMISSKAVSESEKMPKDGAGKGGIKVKRETGDMKISVNNQTGWHHSAMEPPGTMDPPEAEVEVDVDRTNKGLTSKAEGELVASREKNIPRVDPDTPETMLSWKEGWPRSECGQTECAVELSNDIMYDMDME